MTRETKADSRKNTQSELRWVLRELTKLRMNACATETHASRGRREGDAACYKGKRCLTDPGEEAAGAVAIDLEFGAEFGGEQGVLFVSATLETSDEEGDAEQAVPGGHRQDHSTRRENNAGIERMAHDAVRADLNQAMVLLEGHDAAPIAAQADARPKRKR